MRAAALGFAIVLTFIPRAAWPQGDPLGPEFRVNTYTTNEQTQPSIAADSSGNFVVVWDLRQVPPGPGRGVFGQRYSASGVPLGSEFRVNTVTQGYDAAPAVAADSAGNFVVVCEFGVLALFLAERVWRTRRGALGAHGGARHRLGRSRLGDVLHGLYCTVGTAVGRRQPGMMKWVRTGGLTSGIRRPTFVI